MLKLKYLLKELKDDIIPQLKNLSVGTKVEFYGETRSGKSMWKTFYFYDTVGDNKVRLTSGKKYTLDKYNRSNAFVYSNGKIIPAQASGNRPNSYTMNYITDVKIG